ncbi:MAG: hypothetical protein HY908_16255 [Myxococcales bacterium]|nr:hypothetical protein [Myxococcales bacterium]
MGGAALALAACGGAKAPAYDGGARAPDPSKSYETAREVTASQPEAHPSPLAPPPMADRPAPPPPDANGYAPPAPADGDSGGDEERPSQPSPAAAPKAGAVPEVLAQHGSTPLRPPVEPAPVQPGLATSWGETLSSQVTTAPFVRADRTRPFASVTIGYNDAEGIAAMSDVATGARIPRSLFPVHDGFVELGVRDGSGQFLTGFSARQSHFVTGRAGERYTIFLRNHSPGRIETVVSVDGLDVIDGKPAGFAKRGYLLDPNGMLEIDGFRTSESSVAAFRFGSVRDSYAGRKHGDTRNVGVIGAAFFHEQGDDPGAWSGWRNADVIRRQNANPFPAQFATPAD